MSYSLRQNPADPANYTVGREGTTVKKIIIHHAATTDFDGIGATFRNPSRAASAHYGVGSNANVDQYVSEDNIAWQAGNWDVNCESIGIENVNATAGPDWLVADTTFNTLVELVHAIAARHGLLPLKVGINLFGHKDVSLLGTACPVTLEPRLQALADAVNRNAIVTAQPPAPTPAADQVVEVGSTIRFDGTFRVDDLQLIGGIWQVRTNTLCPEGFSWNDNGIPVEPLVEVTGTTPTADQVLNVGSTYKIPGTYIIKNLGKFDTFWIAQIEMDGWNVWVNIEPATEL